MTAASPPTSPDQPPLGQITLRAAPRREPPFDDELPARHLRLIGPFDQPLPFREMPRSPLPRRVCDLRAEATPARGPSGCVGLRSTTPDRDHGSEGGTPDVPSAGRPFEPGRLLGPGQRHGATGTPSFVAWSHHHPLGARLRAGRTAWRSCPPWCRWGRATGRWPPDWKDSTDGGGVCGFSSADQAHPLDQCTRRTDGRDLTTTPHSRRRARPQRLRRR